MNKSIIAEQRLLLTRALNPLSEIRAREPGRVETALSKNMTFDDANGLIEEIYGVTEDSKFWDQMYPQGGATITMIVNPYLQKALECKRIAPDSPTRNVPIMIYKAYGCPVNSKFVEPSPCSVALSGISFIAIRQWFFDSMDQELRMRFDHGFPSPRSVKAAGEAFLKKRSILDNWFFSENTFTPRLSKNLWKIFASLISGLAAACYFGDDEFFVMQKHAIGLFVSGNPILGTTSSGSIVFLKGRLDSERSRHPRQRSMTPEPQKFGAPLLTRL